MGTPGQVILTLTPTLCTSSSASPSRLAGWGWGEGGGLGNSLGIPHRLWSGPLEQRERR